MTVNAVLLFIAYYEIQYTTLMKTRTTLNTRYVICFSLILFLWLFGSQEMYLHKENLTDEKALRYFLYLIWLIAVIIIGYVAWFKHPLKWVKQLWIFMYTIAFLLLLILGAVDLLIISFTKAQKTYIQTFRLFIQSPLPFSILYLFVKVSYKNRMAYSN